MIIQEIFNISGQYGPFILFIYSLFLLRNKTTYLNYYCIGFVIDSILNLVLKAAIQQPRPNIDETQFNLALKHGKRFIYNKGLPYDIFGMPSGHSESCLFSTTYIFLVLKDYKILFGYLLLSIRTMQQRVYYNHHTIGQVIAGACVGILVGYCIYYLSNNKIKGVLKEKQDDNAPKYLNI